MRHRLALIPLLALLLTAAPASAQDRGGAGDDGGMSEGLGLLGEGMQMFLKGLGDELEPHMRDFAEAAEPALARLMELIDDLDAYQLPERLPNGDIIIRRKPDAPPLPDPEARPEGEIEI
ncbi:hypothetical protein [Rhodovulum sulfidophilum]|uniref:hypothetical protein n=1 Tax=Rhodovulum sulfidophilum TaxID=35806 RepID=UPI0009518702|nr:hypothetical protein [Rhodovulum sulfidophilum]MBL3550644.1 AAA+ family ATPase [Rhodovulum sulfidophilum]OLS48750.1 hypothetical protein BV379_11035 [Rhodovulum sulfidophilum]